MDIKYKAFISYRHLSQDKKVAVMLQNKLEHYTVPYDLRVEKKKTIGKIFRDESELPISGNLSDSLKNALDGSEFLIVICSPETTDSPWVLQEVSYFLSKHDRDHILTVLISGNASTSLPKEIINIYDKNGQVIGQVEPLAANLTNNEGKYSLKNFNRESIRIIAALLGYSFDNLWQRDRRYRTQNRMKLLSAVTIVVIAFALSIGLKNRQISEQNAEISKQNTEIIQRNEEIAQKNELIEKTNEDLIKEQAKLLNEQGQQMIEAMDYRAAAKKAVASNDLMYTEEAERILTDALPVYQYNDIRETKLLVQDAEIENAIVTDDGAVIVTADNDAIVRAYDGKTGQLLWSDASITDELMGNQDSIWFSSEKSVKLYGFDEGRVVLCHCVYITVALSVADGKLLWTYLPNHKNEFIAFQQDGDIAYFYDEPLSEGAGETDGFLLSIHLKTGEAQKKVPLPFKWEFYGNKSTDKDFYQYACISSDGKKILLVNHSPDFQFYIVDLDTSECKLVYTDHFDFLYALFYNDEKEMFFAAGYNNGNGIAKWVSTSGELRGTEEFLVRTHLVEFANVGYPVFSIGNENRVIVAITDFLLHFNWEAEACSQTVGLGSPFSYLGWVDSENDIYCYAFESGSLWFSGNGYFANSSNNSWSDYNRLLIPQNNFSHDKLFFSNGVYNFFENEIPFYIIKNDRRTITAMLNRKDENAKYAGTFEGVKGEPQVSTDADGNIYVTGEDGDSPQIIIYDQDANLSKKIALTDVNYSSYIDTILYFNHHQNYVSTGKSSAIYGADGKRVLVMPDGEEAHGVNHTVSNDQLLSASISGHYSSDLMNDSQYLLECCLWIDGELVYSWDEKGFIPLFSLNEPLYIGKNRYAIYGIYNSEGDAFYDHLSILNYDSLERKDFHLNVQMNEQSKVCLAEREAKFASMDLDNVLRVYDINIGDCSEISCGIPMISIIDMQFLLDDKFIAFYTDRKELIVLDLATGDRVFDVRISDLKASSKNRLQYVIDPESNRLFLSVHEGAGKKGSAYCIDLHDWNIVSYISKYFTYENHTKQIIGDTESAHPAIVIYPLHPLADLLAMGAAY